MSVLPAALPSSPPGAARKTVLRDEDFTASDFNLKVTPSLAYFTGQIEQTMSFSPVSKIDMLLSFTILHPVVLREFGKLTCFTGDTVIL